MSKEIDDIIDPIGASPDKDALKQQVADLLAKKTAEAEKKSSSANFLTSFFNGQSQSSRDPVEVMRDAFKDNEIDETERDMLYVMANNRFANRRRMAYIALWAIVAASVFLGISIIVDASQSVDSGGTVSAVIKEYENLLTWFGSFFTAIIALYFGASSLRPSS